MFLGGCSRNITQTNEQATAQKNQVETKHGDEDKINPFDFVVPPDACIDCEINQLNGALFFRSESFETWLAKTGIFGQLVALNDTRTFGLAGSSNWENFEQSHFDHRICDLAYQLIHEKYTDKKLGYLDSTEDRDKTIANLVNLINAENNTKK